VGIEIVAAAVAESGGILRLDPAFVARDWLLAGGRLGLPPEDVDVGDRGSICERWLASTTRADNAVGPDDEGLSYLAGTGMTLADAVNVAPDLILGAEYASAHAGLERLAKIFDYGNRVPHHIHPPAAQAAKVGRNSKDEAYYFPFGVDRGQHPETFMGLHPSMTREVGGPAILQELVNWNSDAILRLSPAYLQQPDDGFFVPSGVLHAPGTALTLELQEDSDTLAMFQALVNGQLISKELLFKDVSETERAERGEEALLDWIDWEENTDPFFFENHHTPPLAFAEGDGWNEAWIFYGSPKFNGKRLFLDPGASAVTTENGVFSLFVWQGDGIIGGVPVRGGDFGADELLVVHSRASEPIEYLNLGDSAMVVIKVFGPDINPGAPIIRRRG
jgi:hypothetical protein